MNFFFLCPRQARVLESESLEPCSFWSQGEVSLLDSVSHHPKSDLLLCHIANNANMDNVFLLFDRYRNRSRNFVLILAPIIGFKISKKTAFAFLCLLQFYIKGRNLSGCIIYVWFAGYLVTLCCPQEIRTCRSLNLLCGQIVFRKLLIIS